MLVSSIFLFVSTILPFAVGAIHGHNQRGRHQELAQRARGDVDIHKRAFDSARFTFYDVGLGACGQYSSPGDFIVALNVIQFGIGFPGPQCFKSITISYGGKTTQATIVDECMGCPYGGLDFSTGLFNFFASQDAGVLYGSWWFNDDASEPAPPASPAWTPTPTPNWSSPLPTWQHRHPVDTPSTTSTTSTSTTETPTSTPSATSTSTTSETTSSTPSTTSTSASSAATSSSISTVSSYSADIPLPTASSMPDAAHPEIIEVLGKVLINLGMLVSDQLCN